jgi:two-component system, OmpR family, KDP operon response regulator KdpE
VKLTPNEWKLLAALIKHAGKVVTQKQLLAEVWGTARPSQEHSIRVYMHQLRQKLEANPADPRFLITEPWVGYRLLPDADPRDEA